MTSLTPRQVLIHLRDHGGGYRHATPSYAVREVLDRRYRAAARRLGLRVSTRTDPDGGFTVRIKAAP